MTKIFAIRNKDTGEFVSCNGHVAWAKAGSAKVSWGITYKRYDERKGAFDKQDTYEIVDLEEAYYRLEGLMK